MTWKLILYCFEPYVLLNLKAPVAKTWIYHGLNIAFLESAIRRLSVDHALFVHHQTVRGDKTAGIPKCIIRKNPWKLILRCFEPYLLLNFKAPVALTWIWADLNIVFLESTVYRLSDDALYLHHLIVRRDKNRFFQVLNRKWRES